MVEPAGAVAAVSAEARAADADFVRDVTFAGDFAFNPEAALVAESVPRRPVVVVARACAVVELSP